MPGKRATPSKPRQRMIAARLSEESYEALVAFTDVHGMTIAALLEAIGKRLRIPEAERRPDVPEWLTLLLEDARRIAAERRLTATALTRALRKEIDARWPAFRGVPEPCAIRR